MNQLSQFDHPPPRSWEQFEELCADTFQALFDDPLLVRFGRAGQAQHGVDILARHGSVERIGLQCKKKGRWPPRRLTRTEIFKEARAAEQLTPKLHQFWILTTAEEDTALRTYVEKLNFTREAAGKFKVHYLGWTEILRLAMQTPWVAEKHFAPVGGGRSPLLAALLVEGGKLRLHGEDLEVTILELKDELEERPDGHVVVSAVETIALLSEIKALDTLPKTLARRKHRLKLRDALKQYQREEQRAADGIRLLLGDRDISSWLFDGFRYDLDVPLLFDSFVARQFDRKLATGLGPSLRLTLHRSDRIMFASQETPPRVSARLTKSELGAIGAAQDAFRERWKKPMDPSLLELPTAVRDGVALPAITGKLVSELRSGTTLKQLRVAGWLELQDWRFEID